MKSSSLHFSPSPNPAVQLVAPASAHATTYGNHPATQPSTFNSWHHQHLPPIRNSAMLKTPINHSLLSIQGGKNSISTCLLLSFCECFSCDLCLYDQNDCQYAIFIVFGDVWNYKFELTHDQVLLNKKKYEFELTYVMAVIFDISHGCMMLDDHFKSIQCDMNVPLKWA